jgi:hypothetical protein
MKYSTAIALFALVLCACLAGCSGGDSVTSAGKGQVRIQLDSSAGSTTAADLARTLEGALPPSPVASLGEDGEQDDRNPGDDSRPPLAAVHVTFSAILARNLDGELIPVEMALPVVVDVLGLVEGPTVTLPVGLLPPGDYDQLVVNMTAVQLVLRDDTRITIEPPGGGWTAIVPADPFTVVEGETTAITLRLRLDRALRFLDGRIEFHPEFECERG